MPLGVSLDEPRAQSGRSIGLRAAYSDYAENVQAFRYSLSAYGLMIGRVLAGKSINFRDVADGLRLVPPNKVTESSG